MTIESIDAFIQQQNIDKDNARWRTYYSSKRAD